jgi:hypothetical protein
MATCDQCGTTIVFGGVQEGGFRFCNKKCRDRAVILSASEELPDEFVLEKARQVHQGACPRCGGRGPVDVHTAHSVWSAVMLTQSKSSPTICCQSCGTKARLKALAASSLLGWWSLPWGLVMTPVQILRNIGGMIRTPDTDQPSEELVKMVRRQLSAQLLLEDSRGGEANVRTPLPARDFFQAE